MRWLQNNSVSIVEESDVPTEDRREGVISQVRWGKGSSLAEIVKLSSKFFTFLC